jgi:hypothetical protein
MPEQPITGKTLDALQSAHAAYTTSVGPTYDDVLHEVADRVERTGSLGKLDVAGLVLWKRLQANTPWVSEFHTWPEEKVRTVTAAAVGKVRDESVPLPVAAREGRAALTPLPGFSKGDALASAALVAAAPQRMAVYDIRVQGALDRLGLPLTRASGRYGRYMAIVEQLTVAANGRGFGWLPRDIDLALFWLGKPGAAS